MENNIKIVKIPIDLYREITGCGDTYEGTQKWDIENGIEITNSNKGDYNFYFQVTDPQKFFLAQVKYGF